MKKLCETAGFLLFVQGAAGLLHAWFDWFRFLSVVRRLPLIGDHTVFACIVLVVTGIAVMIASDSVRE
ncbi:hypothetical protein E6R60_01350 [Streptomyces sp. A0642]|uniref:hypothetical protein n=1 Tax=unclassified Streptomyces TaxID=2593676 RepID=UPI0010A20951|nr:hypothetical protein [Streptomyces sp. A0642]THA79198.1 hypothetical protein E6R60_01350 [Streptomyces sp. A0642]